jgi:antitoxin FitA
MATLTIRQIDDTTKTRLRVRAAHHGRSMEQEARDILRAALSASPPVKGNVAGAFSDDLQSWVEWTWSCRDATHCAG